MSESTIQNHAVFIWSVADLLRGDYKQSEYGRVILPLVVLRRLRTAGGPRRSRQWADDRDGRSLTRGCPRSRQPCR